MLRDASTTSTVLKGNFVNPVDVQNQHSLVRGDRVIAHRMSMVELYNEAERFERYGHKM